MRTPTGDFLVMAPSNRQVSRRDFLIRTALFAAGAWAGTGFLLKPFARALDAEAAGAAAPGIAFILDDVGFNVERVRPFLELGAPLTYAILPHMQFSRSLAEKIHSLGHEIMLHQPMEPHNRSLNPGPGALYLSQSRRDIEKILQRNLENFPHAAGMNNHMGSRFTESRPKMREALAFFLEREFYFIDSCTTERSVGFATARDMHMMAACSHEFIDNTRTAGAVYGQFLKLKAQALKHGCAVGIGHPWPETAQGLKQFLKELKGSPFKMVYASQIACT
jgi:polysaccharide deacetylase 2 family uncharacterized protein YibQ